MSRALVAEYDATENTLRLVEPLKGVSDAQGNSHWDGQKHEGRT
jgi:hypothetical protein